MNTLSITTTGYYSTGSTAIYLLLSEYRTTTQGVFAKKTFEHLPLYMPGGLFDLEDKLLRGNNIHRSDEALHVFYQTMKDLYRNNYQWYGNYKDRFGQEFMDAVDAFIEELTDFKLDAKWYYDYEMKFSIKHTIASAARHLLMMPHNANFFENITYRKKFDDGMTRYAFPSEARFYEAGGKFIRAYINMCRGSDKGVLLLDHFLLPHNLHRLQKYISDQELRVIVSNRDIRDVYLDTHIRFEKSGTIPPVPIEIESFADFMQRMRNIENTKYDEKQILHISYEDLFENYNRTVEKIEAFCGLFPEDHVEQGRFFNPESKDKYMELYTKTSKYTKEVRYLEKTVPSLLYSNYCKL